MGKLRKNTLTPRQTTKDYGIRDPLITWALGPLRLQCLCQMYTLKIRRLWALVRQSHAKERHLLQKTWWWEKIPVLVNLFCILWQIELHNNKVIVCIETSIRWLCFEQNYMETEPISYGCKEVSFPYEDFQVLFKFNVWCSYVSMYAVIALYLVCNLPEAGTFHTLQQWW